MDAHDIGLRRLAAQHILTDRFGTPEAVVAHMGAMQAQDYAQSVFGIGVRAASGLLSDVEAAIERAGILRTWPMRGTIHFVPPGNARWMLTLGAARMIAADQRRMSQLDLTVEMLTRCRDIFIEVLAGRRKMTRSDLLAQLDARGISTEKQRGYHILWYVAQTGVICIGPNEGKEQTFVLLADWAPDAHDLPREQALAELARLYFTSHGPATVHDFAWWAGITVGDARAGLEPVSGALASAQAGKKTWWMAPETASADVSHLAGSTVLLPGFDEFLLGYQDRTDMLPAAHAQKIVPGNNGVFQPMIVIGGQVAGTWRRAVGKKAVTITLIPFEPADAHMRANMAEAAEAYARFVGLPHTVSFA